MVLCLGLRRSGYLGPKSSKLTGGYRGRFEVVYTGMDIVRQEEGRYCSDIRLVVHRKPVDDIIYNMISVCAYYLIGWIYI